MDEPRVPSGDGVLGAADLGARLDDWVADARSRDAAESKARARWLRVQADESATFTGVLIDVAERRTPIVLLGGRGRRHRGVVTVVADDFCALRTDNGHDVLLTYRGITSMQAEGGRRASRGDRTVPTDLELVEMLRAIAADRPRVLIVTTADNEGIAGELCSVGLDVVVVRIDGEAQASAFVPIGAITEITVV